MEENEYVQTAIRWHLPSDAKNDAFLEKVNDKIIGFGKQREVYTFDHVINISDQKKVFEILVQPLVEKSLQGYNCTFLANGQTGSGKTYTLGLESNANINSEKSGMTPRVLNYIFACGKAVQIFVSFIEVYQDQAFDLLAQNPRIAFHKKEHRASEPTKKLVQNDHEVHAILAKGTKNRRVRGTRMNSTSSRSHAVFTIYVCTESGEHAKRESVINLVDLAGSECVSKTGTTGEAHNEGKKINESLSAFKRVFGAMLNEDKQGSSKHIPFRDSLITYILRDSLKIDCFVTLLGCVSPFESDKSETSATLKFVSNAKQIKRTPQVNAIIDEFQKSKTPAKASHLQMVNSPFSAQRLVKFSESGIQSSQRRRTTTNTKLSILNSTKKRTSLNTIRDIRTSSGSVKNPQTKASASKAISGSSCTIDASHEVKAKRKQNVQPDDEDVLNIVKSLENVIKEEMTGGKEFNRAAIADMLGQLKSKLIVQDPSIDVSFCPASTATVIQSPMLSTVAEDTEVVSEEDMDTNESNPNMISSSCQAIECSNPVEPIAVISSENDPVNDLDPTVKVSINYDHLEKRVLFNVEEKSKASTAIPSGTQISKQQNTSQEETDRRCDSFRETSVNESLSVNAQHESMRFSDEPVEAMVTSTTIINSPKISKRIPDDAVRTPIGKLIIRKVAPACDFESTRYAVELISRPRQAPPIRSPISYDDFCETPTHATNTLKMSTAMKRNPIRSVRRLPLSPRIILDRSGTLQPSKRPVVSEPKSKVKPTRITRSTDTEASDKFLSKSTKTDGRQRILEILNTGSGKELQKLSKVGSKTATQILQYRNAKGPFESMEDLVKIGWSKNMCQKFIAANIFL